MEQQNALHGEHLTYFRVENFKRFDSFEMDNIGQFNLLVGDNNVGKTSVLEALLFDGTTTVESHIKNFYFSHKIRISNVFFSPNILSNYIESFLHKKDDLYLPIRFVFKSITPDATLMNLYYDKKTKFITGDLTIEGVRKDNGGPDNYPFLFSSAASAVDSQFFDVPFIYFGLGYGTDLVEYYSEHIQIVKSRRKAFIESLRAFIPNIEEIFSSYNNTVLRIEEKNKDIAQEINTYGEGANKLFRILISIERFKGKRLMIDEIDAGIHFSRFKLFWTVIMKAARAYDVQIFATTHNPDCLKYLKEAIFDASAEDAAVMKEIADRTAVFSLSEVADGKVLASRIPAEELPYIMEHNIEIRKMI